MAALPDEVGAIPSLLLTAFAGRQAPPELLARLSDRPPAGVTLFRQHNVDSAAQVRALTSSLQATMAPGAGPLLIAADQEGGQLIGLGDETTPFAGAMALGAATDADLAERVARATGRELRALGVNVNYAPVCDLATNPANPALGMRSFGDDPAAVGELVAATVGGLQAEGVAATAKHFPGAGEAAADPHHELPVVERSREELLARELVPFRAAIDAGARLVMSGHLAVPAIDDDARPATLSRGVMTGLLRYELGFDGVAVSDALDMKALAQGSAQVGATIAAVRAGIGLLLGTVGGYAPDHIEAGLREAVLRGEISAELVAAAATRLGALRAWLPGFADPPLDVVGCAEHRALAAQLAARSITLVRDDAGLLPLRLPAGARLAVVMPQPADLTPADTSSTVAPGLAEAIGRHHPVAEAIVTSPSPSTAEIAAARERVAGADLLVLGTISASLDPAQAELARVLLAAGVPTITVALRTPWDLLLYPESRTHLCTYGILPPTTDALAAALFGEAPIGGRLPVELAGLYPRGHGLAR